VPGSVVDLIIVEGDLGQVSDGWIGFLFEVEVQFDVGDRFLDGQALLYARLRRAWWFQAFGCVLGFDWHSSGVTTVTCGAIKEAAKAAGGDLGILVAGGKGAVSRKTPQEIDDAANRLAITCGERLVYASRMSAKVDSAAVQDGFGIYHHSINSMP
jgi:hypothetical protein